MAISIYRTCFSCNGEGKRCDECSDFGKVIIDEPIEVDGFQLSLGSIACPEAWEVRKGAERVGLIKVRDGRCTAWQPDNAFGALVYQALTNGQGGFHEEERERHLRAAVLEIARYLDSGPGTQYSLLPMDIMALSEKTDSSMAQNNELVEVEAGYLRALAVELQRKHAELDRFKGAFKEMRAEGSI